LSSAAGLQATTKHSGFPVRMENAVPIVPQAPAAQPLQIQSGVLTQVKNKQKNPNHKHKNLQNQKTQRRVNCNSYHHPGEPDCPSGAGVYAGVFRAL